MSFLPRIHEACSRVTFSPEELAYYARHLLLPSVGTIGQQKLKSARVLVVGAGGLGCPVLQALAGAGVGQLTVVDGDVVALSNVARQWLHRQVDAGRNKAISAVEAVKELNGFIEVESIAQMLTSTNAQELIAAHDIVVDATDDLEVRYLIDDVCAELGRPWVHAALYRQSSQLCVFWSQYGARFRQLFPERSEAPSCAGAGMMGAAASVAANFQALEVIKLITGSGAPKVGEVVSIHSGTLQIQSFRLPNIQAVEPCEQLSDVSDSSMTVDALHQARSIGQVFHVIDLRSASAVSESSIENAQVMSAESILESGFQPAEAQKTLLVCEEGFVSGLLANALRSRGCAQVYHLKDGYTLRAF